MLLPERFLRFEASHLLPNFTSTDGSEINLDANGRQHQLAKSMIPSHILQLMNFVERESFEKDREA